MKNNSDKKIFRGVTIFSLVCIGIILTFDFGNNFPGGALIGVLILGVFSLLMYIALSSSKKEKPPKLNVDKEILDLARYMAPSKDFESFQLRAFEYHQLGFNVTCIKDERTEFSNRYDVYKSPSHEWMNFEKSRQTYQVLVSYDWENAIGTGVVLGYNNLRALDIDNCSDWEFIEMVLDQLGLPQNYEWVVKSGSHNGYHILFYADEHSFPLKSMRLIRAYRSNAKYQDVFEKIELRWSKHLVLPPSLHRSGHHYSFIFNKPQHNPKSIDVSLVEQLICIICGAKIAASSNGRLNLKIPNAYSSSEDQYLDIDSFIIEEDVKKSICTKQRKDLRPLSITEEYYEDDYGDEYEDEDEDEYEDENIIKEAIADNSVASLNDKKMNLSKDYLYTPSDKISFGKNKGYTLEEVYRYNPSYLEWLILNKEEYIINIEAFYNLANPTPYDTYKQQAVGIDAIHNGKTLNEVIKHEGITNAAEKLSLIVTSTTNTPAFPTSVQAAMQAVERGFIIKEVDYVFPDEVIAKNKEKLNNALNRGF
jgi:hypothetical protein